MKIPLVDDDLISGKLLEKVLTQQGFEGTHAADCARALQMAGG